MLIKTAGQARVFFLPIWSFRRIRGSASVTYADITDFKKMSLIFSQIDLVKMAAESEKMLLCGQQLGGNLLNEWLESSPEATYIRAYKKESGGFPPELLSKASPNSAGYRVVVSNKGELLVTIFMERRLDAKHSRHVIKDILGSLSAEHYQTTALNNPALTRAFIEITRSTNNESK